MTDKKAQSLRRVLDSAAGFLARGADDVSMREIADRAHCSTATIYAVYGTKENLLLAALCHMLERLGWPPLPNDHPGKPFEGLLAYAEARARWFARPEQRRVSRSVVSPSGPVRKAVADDMLGKYRLTTAALARVVSHCVAAKSLRALDPDAVAYGILAGTIYEPLVFGLICGEDTEVDFPTMIRKIFTPLVTAKGRRELESRIQRMASPEAPLLQEFDPETATPAER